MDLKEKIILVCMSIALGFFIALKVFETTYRVSDLKDSMEVWQADMMQSIHVVAETCKK